MLCPRPRYFYFLIISLASFFFPCFRIQEHHSTTGPGYHDGHDAGCYTDVPAHSDIATYRLPCLHTIMSAPQQRPPSSPSPLLLPPMDTKPISMESIRPSLRNGPFGIARILVELFSYTGSSLPRRRDPPPRTHLSGSQGNGKKNWRHLRLITIPQSHYCEKVRWGLDLLEERDGARYYYTEDGHPPGLLAFATVPASDGTASASPMIVFDGGGEQDDNESRNPRKFLVQSDVILKELCPFLHPDTIASEIAAMEDDLGRRLGSPARCYFYWVMMTPEYYGTLAEIMCSHTSKIEALLFKKMLDKGIAQAMKKMLKIDKDTARASMESIRQVFDEVSSLLERNESEYLMDTPDRKYGFTASDLTFAALGALILRPPCRSGTFDLPDERYPREFVDFGNELRQTRAGQHVLRMYDRHRPKVDGSVRVKTLDRDRTPWKELAGAAAVAVGVVALLLGGSGSEGKTAI